MPPKAGLAGLISALLLQACSQTPQSRSEQSCLLGTPDQWSFRGRGVLINPEQKGRANIHWHQDEQAYRIVLSGLLGLGTTRLNGDGSHATLARGENTLHGVSAETLLEQATGCLLYTSPSPRDKRQSRMPSSA